MAAWALWRGATVQAQTIKAGPMDLSLGMSVGMQYSDNANTSAISPKEDFGFTLGPSILSNLALPVRIGNRPEERLTLVTSFGFAYMYWLNEGQEARFNAPIGVTLSLPLHFGQWLVTVNDSFTFTDEPLESLMAVGVRRMAQYSNIGTITGTRRYGRFAMTLLGQRNDKWAPQDSDMEETTYSFTVTPALFVQETMSIFWANSVGFIFPKDYTSRSDGINLTSMVGLSGQITPAIAGSIGVGYVHSEFEPVRSLISTNNTGSGTDGISANIGLGYAHPLRPNTTHTIGVFYSPGVTATMDRSNYQTSYGAVYRIVHRLTRNMTMSPQLGWTHSQSESGPIQQEYDMLLTGVAISRSFTRHLSGSLDYRYQNRTSPQPNQSYEVNFVSISLNYTF